MKVYGPDLKKCQHRDADHRRRIAQQLVHPVGPRLIKRLGECGRCIE